MLKTKWKQKWGDTSRAQAGRPENLVNFIVANGELPGVLPPLASDDPKAITIKQHYYPEGQWGWVIVGCVTFVHFLTSALTPTASLTLIEIVYRFHPDQGIVAAGKVIILQVY